MKHEIPKELYEIVEIDGHPYFFFWGKFEFQCAYCLNIMRLEVGKPRKSTIRKLFIVAECQCQKGGDK